MPRSSATFSNGHIPWNKGRPHSQGTIEKIRESVSGRKNASYGRREEKSSSWKGGTSWNYKRAVWERYWNEFLPKGYCIHHVDRNPRNNEISNLALITRSTHEKIHQRARKRLHPLIH